MRIILAALAILFLSASPAEDLKNNPYVKVEEREASKDHLLPPNHPIKPLLDAIFLNSRATYCQASLVEAGFKILKNQPRSFILVVSHPSLPGYLLKLHTDLDKRKKKGHPGWYWFNKRITGARAIRHHIEKKSLLHFKAPQKWLYALPLEPAPPHGHSRKNFVLVVEDMDLLPKNDNLIAWKTLITPEHLQEFFSILKHCGGSSLRPCNIPFSKDGKIAFIDTEYPLYKPDFKAIRPYLNSEMRAYWDKLLKNSKK